MKILLAYIIFGILIISCTCNRNNNKGVQIKGEQEYLELQFDSLKLENQPLKLDHIFILIDSTNNAHKQLVEAGLTNAKNWTTPHPQQGTTGEFFFFLNFYLEFLYVSNQDEATKNIENFGSNYVQRSQWENSSNVPFGLGFVLKDSTQLIPFETHTYKAKWMGVGNVLEMAKSNKDVKEPIVFVEPNLWASKIFESTEQLLSESNTDVKKYRQNSLGIEKLTTVTLVIPKKEEQFSQTLRELKELNNIEIKSGKRPLLILEFDANRQKKELDFEKELGLKIKY